MNSRVYFRSLVLSAGADLWVSLASMFLVIMVVAFAQQRANLPELTANVEQLREENAQLRQRIQTLQKRIVKLTDIQLSGATSGETLEDEPPLHLLLRPGRRITLHAASGEQTVTSPEALVATLQRTKLTGPVMLYVDDRVPFEDAVVVIDAIKGAHPNARVSIAALAK